MKKTISLILAIILLFASTTFLSSALNADEGNTNPGTANEYRVKTGTYVGNGFNTMSLSLEFEPIAVLIKPIGKNVNTRSEQCLDNGIIVPGGWSGGFVWSGQNSIYVSRYDPIHLDENYSEVIFALYGNVLVWEGIPDFAMNLRGVTYEYVAFGK